MKVPPQPRIAFRPAPPERYPNTVRLRRPVLALTRAVHTGHLTVPCHSRRVAQGSDQLFGAADGRDVQAWRTINVLGVVPRSRSGGGRTGGTMCVPAL